MTTPSSFNLAPADPNRRPAPGPPRFVKVQIYKDPSVFEHIDKHAIDEARTNYRSFRDLIYNLIYKKNFNELERARSIFRWMTTKNMFTIMFDSELPGSPEQVLAGFKDGKTTYARIFECLCSYAGMHCVTLSGWAKGVDYRPGNPITSGPINHSWNAVCLDGNWQLVDSHWATRYLQSERNTPENLVYEYDDFYFIPDPSHLVYSHCPEDPAWELLHPSRSRSEYEDYPLVKSFFFNVGMQFLQQNQGVVYTRKGLVTLTFGFTRPTAFTFKIGYGDQMLEGIQGIQLKRYVIQETTTNRVTFYFRSPKEGNYFITVFAQQVSERLKVENVFKAACEYKIVCEQAAGDIRPYPLCSDANWGPGAPVQQYGLTPSHKTAIVPAANGRAEISFAKSRPVRLYARLNKDGVDEETLERCVAIREQDNQVFITVQLPVRGEYGLEVYANEPAKEGDTFTHMCQYLTNNTDGNLGNMYGQVYDRNDLNTEWQAPPMAYAPPASQYAATTPYDKARAGPGGPGDRQVYETSSQDWDGNTYMQKNFREEVQQSGDDHQQYRQKTTQGPNQSGSDAGTDPNSMTTRMETITIGGKKAPGTAPKPSKGGYQHGGAPDDLPPPPPELMDQTYQQQQQKPPEEPKKPPVEIVFVPGSSKGVRPTAKTQEDSTNQRPVEIVYVAGSDKSLPRDPNKQPGGSREMSPAHSPATNRKLQQSQPAEGGLKKGDAARYEALTGSRVPPGGNVPEYGDGGPASRAVPVAVQHQQQQPSYGAAPYGQKPGEGGPYGQARPGAGQDQYYESRDLGTSPYHFGDLPATAQYSTQRSTEPESEYQPHPQKTYTTSITINAPTNFKPVPVYQQESTPKPEPPMVAPKPFKDTNIFQNVDLHAVEVSREDHKSFRDLVWHLIYARDITNELEKARAIFLWLCSLDLSGLKFENVPKGSPEEILMNLQRGQTTYAVVFETLCSYAGLHGKTVSGYAKGAEYKPGMKFTGEQGQHSWNCVLVNGTWRLVDCHWAARRLVGKKVTPENVRYELDEYYFMPDPHQLIFTHFPDDGNWQLLERPITLGDFENLVPVKSAFFKYGLQILSHREAVIHSKREVTVRIGCPPFKAKSLAFTFTLAFDDGQEEFQGTKLNRFGMQEMVDNVVFFTIRPPKKAGYRMIIYAKDLEQTTKEGVYGGVCEYELICEQDPPEPHPFPPCVHTSWGPGDSANKYTLEPLQKGAIFSTVNGLAEVKFHMPKDLRFTAKLKSNDKDEKALASFVMHRVVAEVAVFTISAPNRGEYGLEIYANDPEADGNSLFHAYQYLIICTEVKGPVEPLPTLPPGYLGPQPMYKKLGLSDASHQDPYIQLESGDLQVSFTMSTPLRMTSQLIYVTGNASEDCSDYILQQGRGEQVLFFSKLPKIGMYKLQIYGLPYSDTSESLPGVYNYLINCHNTYSTLIPFPKQYGQWKEGCFLHEPVEGQISPNRPSKGSASSYQYVYFKIDVPKANSVAIVVGEDWTQLEQKTPGSSWEGEVFMEKHWGRESKAAVCANYGNVKASYSTLLEYTL